MAPTRPAPSRRVLEVFEPIEGGVPEHVLRLATGLPNHGWTAEVIGPAGSPWLAQLRDAGVAVSELPLARVPGPRALGAAQALRAVGAAQALRALDRSRDYTIVHAHSALAGVIARLALPHRGRLVYTPHCFAFAADIGATRSQLYRAVEQLLLPRTAGLIAASGWERDQAVGRLCGADDRTRVVRYGVRVAPGAEPDPELVTFKRSDRLVGFLARLSEQKDPVTLVRAAALLHRRGALRGRVALVGNGELRAEVDSEIERLGAGDAVRAFPFRGSVERYLRAFDLMVWPSLWESLPIGLLEAMGCGLPVVASRVGGIPEAVLDGVNGRLIDPGDAEQLAAVLGELLADPDRLSRLGDAGRRIVEERFSIDRMIRQTAEVYDEVVDR